MSGPAVAGIAALMLEANPSLTPFEVRQTLKATAREDNHTGEIPEGGSPVWGWGKVNAIQAVMAALGIQSAPELPPSAHADIQVWPNPIQDEIRVSVGRAGSTCHWMALDLTGRCMASGHGPSPLRIDASDLPAGALLLKVELAGGWVKTFRMVKG